VRLSPLPLKLETLTFGVQGNPLGLELFYVAAALAGAIALVIGSFAFSRNDPSLLG
jgi:hypothetical protein